MEAITYEIAHQNFSTVINQVCVNHTPVIVTSDSQSPVVIMSLEDYNSIEETLYLLRSPQNAQRLYKALDDIKQGKYQEHDLIEEE